MERIAEADFWEGEIWNRRKSGEIYPEWLTISAIRNDAGDVVNYAGVFTDLTMIKRSQASIERLHHFDLLTGLPNRKLLSSLLDEAIDRAASAHAQMAVFVIGLDRFKMINESFSYLAGDQVLRTTAARLRNRLPSGAEIARAGGDQFVVLVSTRDIQSTIRSMNDRLRSVTESPVSIEGQPQVRIQFSTGVACYPDDGGSPDELLGNAEAAMFRAKRSNRGGLERHAPGSEQDAYQKLLLENELRDALDSRRLTVHYQPLVRIDDGRIVGVEALARWPHDDRGMIPPDVFIPIAEETGLIERLSFDLMAQASQSIAELNGNSYGIRLAFNISASLLHREGFVNRVMETLHQAGLAPSRFELELTESLLMEQAAMASGVLDEIREAGVRISIDDFGTGFSSLAYLQQIDAHVLKIDRRFVSDIHQTSGADRIVSAVIAMAHGIGMQVVAEGVETRRQLDFLAGQGCDFYQGYLFSKPMAFDALAELLERTHAISSP